MDAQPVVRIWRTLLPWLLCASILSVLIIYRLQQAELTEQLKLKTDHTDHGLFINVSMATNASQLCTFELFRKFNEKFHEMPSGGHWGVSGKEAQYQPNICKFYGIPNTTLAQCLLSAKVSSVVSFGDSHGRRNYDGMKSYIEDAALHNSCHSAKRESRSGGFSPNLSYYKSNPAWDKYLKSKYRFCTSCVAERNMCQIGKSRHNISLEFLPMSMVIGDTLQLSLPNKQGAVKNLAKLRAPTTQEFYFRYYLADRDVDTFLVHLPFDHTLPISASRLKIDIQHFSQLLKEYRKNDKVRVFYMPAFTLPRNEVLTKSFRTMNRMLYEALEPELLNKSSRHYSFLDLDTVVKDKTSWKARDGHMKPIWYQNVYAMFWETFCNSFTLNAF